MLFVRKFFIFCVSKLQISVENLQWKCQNTFFSLSYLWLKKILIGDEIKVQWFKKISKLLLLSLNLLDNIKFIDIPSLRKMSRIHYKLIEQYFSHHKYYCPQNNLFQSKLNKNFTSIYRNMKRCVLKKSFQEYRNFIQIYWKSKTEWQFYIFLFLL